MSTCGYPSCGRARSSRSSSSPRRGIDQALCAVVMEAYVHGVSTRSVDDLVEAMGVDAGNSKSEVSRICAGLDETVGAFVVATGIAADGSREVLGLDVRDSEDETFWRGFLTTLKQCGLTRVRLVISDQHSRLVKALKRSFQGASHQRCQVHFARNLIAHVPKSHTDMVAAVFRAIFAQPDAETVSDTWDEVRDQLTRAFPKIGPLMDEATTNGKPATAAISATDPWRCSTRTAIMEQSPRSTAASRHRGQRQSRRGRRPARRPETMEF